MDIREFQELLGDMLDELPEPFFDELNGGVIVSPHAKREYTLPGRRSLYSGGIPPQLRYG